MIKHVFVLMLENHSFDNMFAFSGIPNILVATTSNKNSYNGTDYYVQNNAPSQMPTDPGHEFPDVVEQLCGQGVTYTKWGDYPSIDCSGYAANYATTTTEGPVPPAADIGDIMKGFDTPNQLPILYKAATEFAICDHWFSSLPGPTWPNRFFLHGASSAGLSVSPSTAQMALWEFLSGFEYPNGSIFDALTKAGHKWRIYQDQYVGNPGAISGLTPIVTAIKGISGEVIRKVSSLAEDLKGDYPYQYTFIEPRFGNILSDYTGGSSQHPMDGVAQGEVLINTVYEAIRKSPLWNESLLIVNYDEHGGFYDSVTPPAAPAPDDGSEKSDLNEAGFTFKQYGPRVPAVVISPLIPKGTVDHTVYDHASVPATLETLFNFPPLTQRDKLANDVTGLLTLSTPRTDCPESLGTPATENVAVKHVATADDDAEPLPESGNVQGFMQIAHKADLELSDESEKGAIADQFKGIATRGEARAYLQKVAAKLEAAKK